MHENLRKEAPGAAVNESYWRIVSGLPLQGHSVTEFALSAAQALAASNDLYLSNWGRALAVWVLLCRRHCQVEEGVVSQ